MHSEIKPIRDPAHEAFMRHVIPFAVWLVLMAGLGAPAGWKYAVRVVAALAALMVLRPFRDYAPPRIRNLPLALVAGVVVFLLWVVPELGGAGPWAGLREFYLKYAVLPFGRVPVVQSPSPYAPEVCGWPLALVRLGGSALVIAVIEEFFWRGLIYRRLTARDFLSVDPGVFRAGAFLATMLCFGFEHDRWLAGALAGAVYGWVYLRTRDIWAACFAHVVTNLLLGLYVLATGAYAFW